MRPTNHLRHSGERTLLRSLALLSLCSVGAAVAEEIRIDPLFQAGSQYVFEQSFENEATTRMKMLGTTNQGKDTRNHIATLELGVANGEDERGLITAAITRIRGEQPRVLEPGKTQFDTDEITKGMDFETIADMGDTNKGRSLRLSHTFKNLTGSDYKIKTEGDALAEADGKAKEVKTQFGEHLCDEAWIRLTINFMQGGFPDTPVKRGASWSREVIYPIDGVGTPLEFKFTLNDVRPQGRGGSKSVATIGYEAKLDGPVTIETEEVGQKRIAKVKEFTVSGTMSYDTEKRMFTQHDQTISTTADIELPDLNSTGSLSSKSTIGIKLHSFQPGKKSSVSPKPSDAPAPTDLVAERVWTDLQGRELTAALVSLDAGIGKFRRDNGKSFNYAIKNLSAADRKLIEETKRDLEEKAKPSGERPEQEENALTVEQTTAAIRELGGKAGVGRAMKNGDTKLRGGPDLVWADFSSSRITDASLAKLEGLNRIWLLELGQTKIGDTGLAHLQGLTRLEFLGLIGTNVTDAGLARLKGLKNLELLNLASTSVTDTGLEHLQGLTHLEDLHFGGTKVGDAGLAHLKGLTNLRLLHLGATRITDAGLAHLKNLDVLEQLTLETTGITDAGLEHLRGLTKLFWLGLGGTAVSDAGLEQLEGMPGLKRIDLSGTGISDRGLAHLKGMKLDLLHPANTGITDAGLEHLREMTTLKWMNIGGNKIGDAGLAHLKGLTQLELLNLFSTQVTDAGLAHLKGLTNLETLSLPGTTVTDAGLEHLHGLASLTKLDLRDTQVTDVGIDKLQAALPKCKIQH